VTKTISENWNFSFFNVTGMVSQLAMMLNQRALKPLISG
jgi:hypothetical protein